MGSSSEIRAGRAFVEVFLKDGVGKGLQKIERGFKAFGNTLSSAGKKLSLLSAAVTGPMIAAAKSAATSGAAIYDMSKRTGISVEKLSQFGFAASVAGSSLEELEPSIKRMQKTIAGVADVTEGTTGELGHLGIAFDDIKGKSPDQQFELIAKKIGDIQDPSLRAAAAMKVFGRSGTTLLPMIENLSKSQKLATQLGLVKSTEAARKQKEFSVAMMIAQKAASALSNAIGSAIIPTLEQKTIVVTRIILNLRSWVVQNQQVIVTVFKVATAVGVAGVSMVLLGKAIAAIGPAFGIAASAARLFAVTLAAIGSPGLAVIAIVGGLAAAIIYYSGAGGQAIAWLGRRFDELRSMVGDVVKGITDAITAGDVKLAAEILWAGLKLLWIDGTSNLSGMWIDLWFKMLGIVENITNSIRETFLGMITFLTSKLAGFTATASTVLGIVALVANSKGYSTIAKGASAGANAFGTATGVLNTVGTASGAIGADEAKRHEKAVQDLKNARDAGDKSAAEAAQAEIDSAKKKLDGLRGQASTERQLKSSGSDPLEAFKRLVDTGGGIAGAADELGKRTTAGTFSGALAGQALGAGGAAEKTAKHAEHLSQTVDRIWTAFQSNGLNGSFT